MKKLMSLRLKDQEMRIKDINDCFTCFKNRTDILRKNNISTFLLDAEILLSNATDLNEEEVDYK